VALLIGVAAACLAPTAMADSYNIVTGFSNTSNPNGVWSYYYGTGPSTQTLYTSAMGGGGSGGVLPYWSNGGTEPDTIFIVQNTSGAPVTSSTVTQPNNTLRLDPQEYNVGVMFTAPASGTYDITGNFLGIDEYENSHPVEILEGGAVVWSGTISSYGQDDSFNLTETLSAGETIEFYVLTGSPSSYCSYCDLGTGLDGSITEEAKATPEPETLALLGAGLVGLIGARRRLIT